MTDRVRLLDRIRQAPLVFDGAMGTMFYARGVFINTCYDDLCRTRPDLVRAIHADYVEAGADVIETNTFGANRLRLRPHGLADHVEAINTAGVRLAREVAGDRAVAASVGPCLSSDQAWDPGHAAEIRDALAEQMAILARAGVDLFALETFIHPEELALAASIARATGVPVLASLVLRSGEETALGTPVEEAADALDRNPDVDMVGFNCGVGPSEAYEAVERILPLLDKPLVVMPNGGLPRTIDGRTFYLASPEYFTEYAKKLIELGVRGVGGCCGTTPDHIREAARAVKSLSGVKRHAQIRAYHAETVAVRVTPAAEKSRFARLLAAGERVTSVELLPPKSSDMAGLLDRARRCREAGVDAINIPDGPRASARVSPLVSALTVLRDAGIEPVLHYCCRDRNLIGMQSDLLGAHVVGVRNLLVITGDPPKLGDYPDATAVFDVDAIGLMQVVSNLNHGRDIGGNAVNPPTALFAGVGANPCAVSPELERERYRRKLEAGAEFAITQPVFDADALLRFLDAVEAAGPRRIPVLAGVWPLLSLKNAEFMRNEVPGMTVPDDVMDRMRRCATKEDAVKTGIDIAREIVARITPRVAGFQVSAPLGRVDIALQVLAGHLRPVPPAGA
jgi:homocysteine S-methyltransferase